MLNLSQSIFDPKLLLVAGLWIVAYLMVTRANSLALAFAAVLSSVRVADYLPTPWDKVVSVVAALCLVAGVADTERMIRQARAVGRTVPDGPSRRAGDVGTRA